MNIQEQEILVIGAGPAGLSVAAECVYHDLPSVRVIEKGPSHNQTVLQYYPDDKRVDAAYRGQEAVCAGVLCFRDTTKPNFLAIIDEILERYGFQVTYNVNVDSIKHEGGYFFVSTSEGALFKSKFVVICVGRMGKPNRPDFFNEIPSNARKHVQFDIRNLDATGKEILVVGGGNSAIEFALSLANRGKVTVSYRKDTFSRLNPMNLEILEKDEKEGLIAVLRNSNLTGIRDENGKPHVIFKEGPSKVFDNVVFGIGGSSPAGFLASAGLNLDEKGNPILSPMLESNIVNLYVAGELCVPQGKGSIIASFNSGKRVVEGIAQKLGRERKPEIVSLNFQS